MNKILTELSLAHSSNNNNNNNAAFGIQAVLERSRESGWERQRLQQRQDSMRSRCSSNSVAQKDTGKESTETGGGHGTDISQTSLRYPP